MKLRIKEHREEQEEVLELWLEEVRGCVYLMSNKGKDSIKEFCIHPDGNWGKILCGNLKDNLVYGNES